MPDAPRLEPWLEQDDDAWDDLCAAHGDLFQSSAVSRAAEVFGCRVRRVRALGEDGRPLFAVALIEAGLRRARAAEALFARRLQVQGGPLPLAEGGAALAGALAGVERFARERRAVETDWKPTWPGPGEALGFEREPWSRSVFGVAWRELPADPEAVLPSLSRAHRKAVRGALRDGVQVRDAGLAEVTPLVDRSFRRAGLPARDPRFLAALHAGLVRRGAATALLAERDGRPLAALLAGRSGDAVFNLFHGRTDDSGGAANLLHLRLMEDAVRSGARRIHTGDALVEAGAGGAGLPRSAVERLEGIARFKRGLGFRVDPCPRGVCVHRPLARRLREAALGLYLRRPAR